MQNKEFHLLRNKVKTISRKWQKLILKENDQHVPGGDIDVR